MRRPLDRLQELAQAPLGRLLLKYSWPALVTMTLSALYAAVDRFWVGHGGGADAMAALTLTFPVMMVFQAFGVWIGVGHSSVLSLKLGEGDRVAAEKTLGQLVAFKLLFFCTLPLAAMLFLTPLLRWTGGADVSASAFADARLYLLICLPAQVFSHLAFGLAGMMRAEGALLPSMSCMIVGFGTNMVLDPILIYYCKMGVGGAAWATDAGMVLSCAWALAYYLRRGRSVVKLRWGRIRIYRELLGRAMGIGLSPFLQNLMGALITFALQVAFARWAADETAATRQIAALGIFQVAMMAFFMPVMGLQQGLAPIMGFNWGARNYARVRKALMLGLWLATACVTFAAAVQVVCPEAVVRLFTDGTDAAFIRLAGGDLRISNCMLWCIGLNIVCTTYFQAIGRPRVAIVLSMLRQGFCLLPCIFILPHFFRDAAFGIWLAMPVSDVLAFLATIPPFIVQARYLGRLAGLRRKCRPGRMREPRVPA